MIESLAIPPPLIDSRSPAMGAKQPKSRFPPPAQPALPCHTNQPPFVHPVKTRWRLTLTRRVLILKAPDSRRSWQHASGIFHNFKERTKK